MFPLKSLKRETPAAESRGLGASLVVRRLGIRSERRARRLSPWWWHWEPTCNWITFAVDWSNSKQSGPNQELVGLGREQIPIPSTKIYPILPISTSKV